jgi:hypothetical protein
MVQIRERCQAAGSHAPRPSLVAWFAMAFAAAVFVSLALAAAKSGGLDRLLPKDQPFPFVPYFTT